MKDATTILTRAARPPALGSKDEAHPGAPAASWQPGTCPAPRIAPVTCTKSMPWLPALTRVKAPPRCRARNNVMIHSSATEMRTLFDPIRIGEIQLANRIVMAPLTRNRAAPGNVPSVLAVEYYRQRASAGLIITEGSQVCPEGQGYVDTPGIHSVEQVEGWRRVTDAVHAEGGRIVIQLWHVGRVSHVSLQPGGNAPVSPSARRAETKTYLHEGFVPVSSPRALTTEEIPAVVESFRTAARRAMEAGFDGVEVHGANGYLVDQFLRDSVNDRVDQYGGSIAKRTRFLVEVMRAVAGAVGSGRTGLRLSPVTPSNDIGQDSHPQPLFEHALAELAPLGLAFIEVVEGQTAGARDFAPFDYAALRRRFSGAWIVNNGYQRQMAFDAVASGAADCVSFGRPFIANPDLVRRLHEDAPLNVPNTKTFYGGGAEGYVDYPTLDELATA
jgi:N-ethylmaleimide reductase